VRSIGTLPGRWKLQAVPAPLPALGFLPLLGFLRAPGFLRALGPPRVRAARLPAAGPDSARRVRAPRRAQGEERQAVAGRGVR
jgi:hypothetical protein